MRNDRDDNYEEPGSDSEYHFSEEEHYDADPGAAKSSPVSQEGTLQRAAKSKRLLISFGLFMVLVVIAYKMMLPSTTAPSVDIAPVTTANKPSVSTASSPAATAAPAAPAQTQSPANQQTPQTPQIPAATGTSGPQQDMAQMTQAMTKMMNDAAAQAQAGTQQQAASPQQQPPGQNVQPPQPSMPGVSTVPVSQAMTPPPQQPATMPQQPVDAAMQPASTPMTETPPVSVVQGGVVSASNQVIDSASAMMANQADQMEAAAAAKVNQQVEAYEKQNQLLKDQLETLNGRVALMEQRLTTLVQALSQQYQGGPATPTVAPMPLTTDPTAQAAPLPQPVPAAIETQGPAPRVPYNVQAIIPGRAWLRSNNGDTVTVAEGDEIKGVGRVTKIDPYDGVVVIDVRGRSVSLSYGSGS